uniref:Uncharacterized protein n=1 Tax=Oryza glaberrima TaxID=4538 RepID=I1R520_ORYGL
MGEMVAGLLDDALGAPESVEAAPGERDSNCGAVEMVEAADGGDGGLIWIDQLGGMLGALSNAEMATRARAVLAGDGGRAGEVGDVGGGYPVRLCLSFNGALGAPVIATMTWTRASMADEAKVSGRKARPQCDLVMS